MAHHCSIQHVQRGKQGCCSITAVIVRLPLGQAFAQRQNRLLAVQCLNLTLFVHTENQRIFGRISVQTDNIPHFIHELRIPARVELLHAVRLQSMSPPGSVNGGVTYLLRSAIIRVLQCVAFLGLVFKVASTIAASFSALIVFLRPGRGASIKMPSTPDSAKRSLHFKTVVRVVDSRLANSLLETPSNALNMMRMRNATFCGVLPALSSCSSRVFSSALTVIASPALHVLPA